MEWGKIPIMDCQTLIENEELMETIVELSSEWLLVFDSNYMLVFSKLPKNMKNLVDDRGFYDHFQSHEADRFQSFLYLLSKGKESRSETFQFMLNLEPITINFSGVSLSEGFLLKGKKVKDEEEQLKAMFSNTPIPCFALDTERRIRYHNTLFKDLLEIMNEPLNTSSSILNEKHSFHRTIRKLSDIVNEKNKLASIVYEKEDIRLTLYGYLMSPTVLCVYIKDETIEHRFEQLLTYKQQMESVSQIAAGVAHELRNPLSVIKGFIQLSKLSNSLNKYYETISSEIDRMNLIIEDFLSMSRKKIDKKKVLPSDLLESMLMIFRSECLLHDIDFSFAIKDSRRYLYVNDQMIRQVMLNVLRNSIEAYENIQECRKFTMLTTCEADEYVIILEDFGPGVPEHVLKEIEKPFFTTKDKGTGIGIPLCKRIVEEHMGSFTIESEVGMGTKIMIRMPLYRENEQPEYNDVMT